MARLGIPFGIQHAPSRHEPLANRRCINLYAEPGLPDSKAPLALFRDDGIEPWADMGGNGPVRGLRTATSGILFGVADETLYSINQAGAINAEGTVPGGTSVMIDQNGDHLVILNEDGDSYVFNLATDVFAQITDPDYQLASSMCAFGQYIVWTKQNSGAFFISALADATSIDALDIASAEAMPDELVRCFRVERTLFLFGKDSLELWYESGATFPFDRIADGVIDVGLAAKHSVVLLDSTAWWLGIEKGGIAVRRMADRTAEIVSSSAMCDELATYTTFEDAFAFAYVQGKHAFYVITFPSEGTTWRYDVATGLWTKRQSYLPTVDTLSRWRAQAMAPAYQRIAVADYYTGKVGLLNADWHYDFDRPLYWETVSGPVHKDRRLVTFNRVEIEVNAGQGSGGGEGTDPTCWLSWSDNDGRTWSNEYERSMGAAGQYNQRLIWTNLGSSRGRIFKLRGASPIKTAIITAVADVEIGV